jgi:hypothetical protein
LQERIVTQMIVIVEVLIAHRNGKDPLRQQGPQIMDRLGRVSRIAHAGRQGIDQPNTFVDLT